MVGNSSTDGNVSEAIGAQNASAACAVYLAHDYVFDVVLDEAPNHHTLLRELSPWGVLVPSLVLCFFGYYAIRLVVAVAAFGAGALGMVRLANMGGAGVSCDVVTLGVSIAGGVSALVAVLMVRLLSLVLGAAAACGVVGVVFVACGPACDADLWAGAPRFVGLTLVPFWASMLVGAAVGAAAVRRRHREMLATMAAMLGGFGVASAVRSLVAEGGHVPPPWLFAATLGGSAGVGLLTQYAFEYRRQTRKRRPKKGGRETREDDDAA